MYGEKTKDFLALRSVGFFVFMQQKFLCHSGIFLFPQMRIHPKIEWFTYYLLLINFSSVTPPKEIILIFNCLSDLSAITASITAFFLVLRANFCLNKHGLSIRFQSIIMIFFTAEVAKDAQRSQSCFYVLCVKSLRSLRFNHCSFYRRGRKGCAEVAEFSLCSLRKIFAFFAV